MKRVGNVWSEEGLVIAIEPGGAKGARVTVETDEMIRPDEVARGRYRVITFYMTAVEFAALIRAETDGCHDVLLGRRLPLSAFGGRRVDSR